MRAVDTFDFVIQRPWTPLSLRTEASVRIVGAKMLALDEHEHRRGLTRTLSHRLGEASLGACHALVEPSMLVEQRHYQPRNGRRTR